MYIICIEYIQPWLLPSNSLLVLPVHILPPFYVPFGCCCLFVCLISGPLSPTVHGCAVIHWEWQPYQSSHCQKIVILPSPEATSCQWSSARVGALGATCSNFKLFLDVLKLKCNYVVSLLPIFFCNPSHISPFAISQIYGIIFLVFIYICIYICIFIYMCVCCECIIYKNIYNM